MHQSPLKWASLQELGTGYTEAIGEIDRVAKALHEGFYKRHNNVTKKGMENFKQDVEYRLKRLSDGLIDCGYFSPIGPGMAMSAGSVGIITTVRNIMRRNPQDIEGAVKDAIDWLEQEIQNQNLIPPRGWQWDPNHGDWRITLQDGTYVYSLNKEIPKPARKQVDRPRIIHSSENSWTTDGW